MSRRPVTVWNWIARGVLAMSGAALTLLLSFTIALYVGVLFRLAHAGWKLAWW